jgi:hypothetical protein
MSALWSYFWPVFAAGLVVGAIAGSFAFRRAARRNLALVGGAAAALAAAALWHGPLGGGARFADEVERQARETLVSWEMPQVTARLHQDPLSRRLMLSGTADDFQRRELVRIMGDVPGVRDATWQRSGGALPLLAEAALAALVGFAAALILAYLVALRRRYTAQFRW